MKICIDTTINKIVIDDYEISLYSKEGFKILSEIWLKVGWDQKYIYGFSWLGRPIIQLPEDIIRIQEVVYNIKPDVIIETEIAHGGTSVFFAGLCKIMDNGRVISVDVEIRSHNRKAIESHELFPWITLIEGDSISDKVIKQIQGLIDQEKSVLVVLDSNHTKTHVLKELELYSQFVSIGSYIVATDGSMEFLYDVPRGNLEWKTDNPVAAVKEFVKIHPEFIIEEPKFPFNEGNIDFRITHWPSAFLKRMY